MKLHFYTKRCLGALLLSILAVAAWAQSSQLWGTTQEDGRYAQGTIFTTDADGTNITPRYQFGFEREGRFVGDIVEFNGEFYATAYDFDADDINAQEGVLFKWNPTTDAYTVLHRFNNATGNNPTNALFLRNNKLYGTTRYGGLNDGGVIYEFDPVTHVYTKRADLFTVVRESSTYGEMSFTMMNGKFYGVVYADTGTIGNAMYEWDPDTNTFSKVRRAAGASLPYNTHEPFTRMTEYQGKLYTATRQGGSSGFGEIVEWDVSANTYVAKTHFPYPMGRPISPLTEVGGKFYGITDKAELFEWDPVTNVLAIKRTVASGISINNGPVGLTLFNGKLYGQANGGASGQGFIYEWDPATNEFTDQYDYTNGRAGAYQGQMFEWQGKLWGRQPAGVEGFNNTILYAWDPVTNAFEGKFMFNVSEGRGAKGALAFVGGKLYGMGQGGGSSNQGVIFAFDPGTMTYKRLQSLNTSTGSGPLGSFTYKSGKLYGMAQAGGLNGAGTIFELDISTNTLTKKIDFADADGRQPSGNLVEKDGKFYGMTAYGGANNYGVIFEWDPATNIFTKKIDFDAITGGRPTGDLLVRNGKFYGTLSVAGTNLAGAVFEWDPVTNSLTKRLDLSSATGGNPAGSFIVYNSRLYTTTSAGGTYGVGTVLEWDPETNTVQPRAHVGTALPGSMTLNDGKYYYLSGNPANVMEWNPITNTVSYKGSFTGEWNHIWGNRPTTSTLTALPEGGLPVRLVDFNAKWQEHNGVLSWRTTEESNFSHFELQRSPDARTFGVIGTVDPSPTGNYTFTDLRLSEVAGANAYYRLKMIDLDGTFAYSAIARLALPETSAFVYPNPTAETLHVKHVTGLSGEWQLADADGNAVMSGKSNGGPFKLHVGGLDAGIYFLRFSSGQTFKVLKN